MSAVGLGAMPPRGALDRQLLVPLVVSGEVETPVYDIARSRAVDTTSVRAAPQRGHGAPFLP